MKTDKIIETTKAVPAVESKVKQWVRPLVERLRSAALPGTIRNALDNEAAAEIERMRAILTAIDSHSVFALRMNSNDCGDWAEDMAFLGKLARGH